MGMWEAGFKMGFADIIFTIVIFPIEQIIALTYSLVLRVFHDPALAVIAVSAAVSVLTLPLYFAAEKLQQAERDTQARLKPEADNIRAVFRGDERYMILSTYYRQNKYHPIYALRSSLGLLIQIPFFIAAYHFLSHLSSLNGARFLFIDSLGKPDALLSIGGFSVNVLPLVMTAVNCASAAIYSKGFPLKEKIQLYGMAAVFLVLLYASPAGLVLYWTCNNIFSLVKNALQRMRGAGIIITATLVLLCALVVVQILFFHHGALQNRLAVCAVILFTLCLFLLRKPLFRLFKPAIDRTAADSGFCAALFFASVGVLCALLGFAVPAALIGSSPQEFSYIAPYSSPFPFLTRTALQSAGIFLFFAPCFYLMLSRRVRAALSAAAACLAACALTDVFLFTGDYGDISPFLLFSAPGRLQSPLSYSFVNITVLLAACATVAVLVYSKKRMLLVRLYVASLVALLVFDCVNISAISREFTALAGRKEQDAVQSAASEKVFEFSRTGKNVLVIMLDRAMSGFVPYLFEEKPELQTGFDGFTWYRNCVSFGGVTLFGAPPIYGGYEYAPLEMQRRSEEKLKDKHDEALMTLPKLFSEADYAVTVTDPPFAGYSWTPDLTVFQSLNDIKAQNLIGAFTESWKNAHPDLSFGSSSARIEANLIRFSFFKAAPALLRPYLYDKGNYFSLLDSREAVDGFLNNYAVLDALPQITAVTDADVNTCTVIQNDLPHNPVFLQAPDYLFQDEITNYGSSPFAYESHYHVNMAAFLLLSKWFAFMKEQGVYDNTRIIVVSDHGFAATGYPEQHTLPDKVKLPNGEFLFSYTALLMVKDFGAHGGLAVSNTFMTNAETPFLAREGLLPDEHPFTHVPFMRADVDGVTITTSHRFTPDEHGEYLFDIKPSQWLHVRENIYDPVNWSTPLVTAPLP